MARTGTWTAMIVMLLALSPVLYAQHSHGHHHHHHGHHHHHHHGGFRGYSFYRPYFNNWSGSVYLGIGGPYGYSSFGYYNGPVYGFGYPYVYNYAPYGTYCSPRTNYVDYYLSPIYQPAELAYGPQAMKQFLGLDRNFALGDLVTQPRPVEVQAAKPIVSELSVEARQKADRFIELGDQNFKAQKFHDALLRYRMAIDAAPTYAMAHLRHGFSLVANRRYEEAARALAKAFALDPQIMKSGFRIDALYADNRMAREGHQEGLAQAALNEPSRGDLHFVVGMWLAFSGEVERSRKFFEKARELGIEAGATASTESNAKDI
jgi:Tfp pilus assembly protein PilF